MRRLDRKTEDYAGILKRCKIVRLGLCGGGMPYIVPMNYGYDFDGSEITLYLHSARQGKKLDLLRENSNACFEMDGAFELKYNAEEDSYTSYYECLMGFGQAEIVEAFDEKRSSLIKIMEHQCGEGAYDFDEKTVNAVTIMKMKCTDFSAKANKGKAENNAL